MRFQGTIHSAELVRVGHTIDEYSVKLDLRICMGYEATGENDEHICAVFPDSITTEIGFAMFLCDLEILCEAGFRGEVILERDILQLTKYMLTDNGVVTLDGEIIYNEVDAASVLRGTYSGDGQPAARLGVSVGIDDLNEQYAWLIEQATAIRKAEKLTVMPEPLIGLLNYLEGLREVIRETDPRLCPLLDRDKPEQIVIGPAAVLEYALKAGVPVDQHIQDKCPNTIQYINDNVEALEALGIDVNELIANNEALVKIVDRTGEIIVREQGITYDDAVYLAIKEVMTDKPKEDKGE